MQSKRDFYLWFLISFSLLFHHLPILSSASFWPWTWIQGSARGVLQCRSLSSWSRRLQSSHHQHLSASKKVQKGRDPNNHPFSCHWIKKCRLPHFCYQKKKKKSIILHHIEEKSPLIPFSPPGLVLLQSMLEAGQRVMAKLQHLGCVGFQCLP